MNRKKSNYSINRFKAIQSILSNKHLKRLGIMKLLKELLVALMPLIGLVVMGFIAYILFSLLPISENSGDDDIQILIGFWLLLMPIVLVFLAIKSNEKNKD